MTIERCFDCFQDLGPRRFVVLKRMRDMPEIPGVEVDPVEARMLDSMNFDEVFLCLDCGGWYDDAIEVEV